MGVIDDIRKVIQDLVAPELKALTSEVMRVDSESRTRDESLAALIQSLARESKSREELILAKLETITAKMEFQYASIVNSLNLDRRVESLERDRHSPSA